MVKTSITLDDDLLNRIEEYRSKIRPIPSRSEAIKELLGIALKEDKMKSVVESKKAKEG